MIGKIPPVLDYWLFVENVRPSENERLRDRVRVLEEMLEESGLWYHELSVTGEKDGGRAQGRS